MQQAIICVGHLKEKFWADASAEYEKRIGRFASLEVIEVPDLPEPAHSSPAIQRQIMEKEGKSILARIRPGDFVAAMCIDAPRMDSEDFARFVREVADSSRRLVLVIGGSLGLSGEVVQRADRKISMSPMTFPHQLARIMTLEQLYRAHKINGGERYHK